MIREHRLLALEAERALDELHVGHEIKFHEVKWIAELSLVDWTGNDRVLDGYFRDFDVVWKVEKIFSLVQSICGSISLANSPGMLAFCMKPLLCFEMNLRLTGKTVSSLMMLPIR